MAAVQAAQAVKEVTQMTEHHSLQLTRNLLRIAIFHISYIRELFPEDYFRDTSVQSLHDMKVKKLLPMDLESRRLIDWMEKGVYDALKKKYLKTMLFILCEGEDGPAIEEYSFSFDYSTASEEVSMHMTKNGHHKKTLIKGNADEIDHEQMRKSACKMMRTLVTLMQTLDVVPNERTILVKLHYYDDVTPVEYEPPFFRCCTFDDKKSWRQPPFRMKAGEVNSKFITFSLKVKSTLDPCEDENDKDSACAPASTGACSEASSDSGDSDAGHHDCEANGIQDDTADNCTSRLKFDADETRIFEDDDMTQDLKQETSNFETVKEWLLSRPPADLHIADLMANFPEISERHTEELLSRMVKENLLIDLGKDNYKVNRLAQVEDYNEAENLVETADKDLNETQPIIKEEDFMYMKALYYALPLDYVTITQLQTNLGNEINYLATRKLVEKMVNEGYVEGTMANRKIGRRVIHSEQAQKKFQELRETLHPRQSLNQEMNERGKPGLDAPLNHNQQPLNGKTYESAPFQAQVARTKEAQLLPQRILPTEDLDGSTCGALQSFGSEFTRHGVGSPFINTYKAEEMASSLEHKISKRANSGESHLNSNNACIFSPLKQKAFCKRGLEFRDSQDTFDKATPRKASMVEEPIYQAEKRHRRR